MSSISFIVPCLNEEGNLKKTISTIAAVCIECSINAPQIIIVDDGSTDKTLILAQTIAAERQDTCVIAHTQNMGLGAAYKSGLSEATREYVMLIPGDDAWSATELAKIIRSIGSADIVIPYIVKARDKGLARQILSRVFTTTINFAFGQRIPYYNGVVIHRTALIRAVMINSNDFAYQVEGLLKVLKAGASFAAIATETNARPSGRSKALGLKNIVRVHTTLVRLFFEIQVAPRLHWRRTTVKDRV